MTVGGSGKYKTYYCAAAKEMGASVCSGFRGLRESAALPVILPGLRTELMAPATYERFREHLLQRLRASQGSAEDHLHLHDTRVRDLEKLHRNLLQAIEMGKTLLLSLCG